MEFDVKEIIRNALVPKKDSKWELDIKADLNDADYVHEITTFNDKEFLERGFAVCLLAHYLTRYSHLEENEWLERGICEYLPSDDWGCAHTIYQVKVTRGGSVIQFDLINEEIARELIRQYYLEYVIPEFDYEDEECDLDEVLDTIFDNNTKSK